MRTLRGRSWLAPTVAASVLVSVLLAGCGPPATEEGFHDAYCAAEATLLDKLNELPLEDIRSGAAIPDMQSAWRQARSDWAALPAWPEGQEAKEALVGFTDQWLEELDRAVELGGVEDREQWDLASRAVFVARGELIRLIDGCV